MSNSANSDEIDEVMSSVRKLVTKGEGKVLRDDDADSGKQASSERLILTPALRVDEVEAAESTGPADADNVLMLDPGNRTELEGLEATIAELEAAVTTQPDDWEPDEGETFDEAAWAVSAFATPEAEAESEADETSDSAAPEAGNVEPQEPASAEPEAEFSGGLSDFLDPSATIDQDILRDMIAQIVREELSGETGERITRNVRKLVRREINQILATRDIR